MALNNNAININAGFEIGSSQPIDSRQLLTKAQMLSIDDNIMPSKYFCICKDDGLLYTYDANNEVDEELGKFRVASGIKFYQIGNGETLENAVSSKNDDIFFVYKNDGYETMYYLCFRSEVTKNIRRDDSWTVYYKSTVTIITKNRNGQVNSKVFDMSNIEVPGAVLAYDYSGTIDCDLMLSSQGNTVYGALFKTQNRYQIPQLEGLYDSYVLSHYPVVGEIIVSDTGLKYGEITGVSDDTYTYKTIRNATGTFTQSQISTNPTPGPVYVCNALPITNADDIPALDNMTYTGSEFTFTYLGESFSDSSHGNIQKGHTYFATFDTETNKFVYKDITPAGSSVVVDQTYNPASTNPQSGTAVAQAINSVVVPYTAVAYDDFDPSSLTSGVLYLVY